MRNMVLNNVRPFVDGKFGEPTKIMSYFESSSPSIALIGLNFLP